MLKSVILWQDINKKENNIFFFLQPVTTGDDVVSVELDNEVNLLYEFDGDNIEGFSSMIVGNA